MPRLTSWADLSGGRVGLWGLGVEGRASLRRLRLAGVEPVLVDRSAHRLEDGSSVLAADEAGLALLAGCEVVVKSPGISRYGQDCRQLVAAGVEVVGGLGLWMAEVDRARVLCITGTKGKSTTTSIVGALLAGLGHRFLLAGNIGVPPWDPAAPSDVDWWVVETSSYQALDLACGPAVVAVTSLSEDHLPWHGGSAEAYYADKLSLCTLPGVTRVVANGQDSELRAHAALLGPAVQWVEQQATGWAQGGQLLGSHNQRNAEIARQALSALGVPGMTDEAALGRAFAGFTPLPHRLAIVAELDGVTFVNDSISTNVLSTLAAIESFPGRRLAVLVGGLERDIDYLPLASRVAGDDVHVFTMPSNGAAIGAVLRSQGEQAVTDCGSLADAVQQAYAWARPGGVVLLSPAAASFDLYDDYRARGAAFVHLVQQLAG